VIGESFRSKPVSPKQEKAAKKEGSSSLMPIPQAPSANVSTYMRTPNYRSAILFLAMLKVPWQ